MEVFEVCPSNTQAAKFAQNLPASDFEDGLQISAAVAAKAEIIVTRNTKDFAKSPVPALSPNSFLKKIGI
ncbi:MAG: PIN domain-containing protein [Verrucomicrobiota bacterium]